jgi:hypothetical protein
MGARLIPMKFKIRVWTRIGDCLDQPLDAECASLNDVENIGREILMRFGGVALRSELFHDSQLVSVFPATVQDLVDEIRELRSTFS